jgi:hypothetical protein
MLDLNFKDANLKSENINQNPILLKQEAIQSEHFKVDHSLNKIILDKHISAQKPNLD